jgi:hypothetical protein
MYEREYVSIFNGGKKAFVKYCESQYEWAEGPMSFTIISKDEYEEEKGVTHHRDRVMEAFENGNGNSIYV